MYYIPRRKWITYTDAGSGPGKQYWLQATARSCGFMKCGGTLMIQTIPVKCSANGFKKNTIVMINGIARIVVECFTQKAGVDYQETSSL